MASMPAATIYPQSHVGFDSITSQIERKLLKRGFQFNVICVGQFPRPQLPHLPAICQLHFVFESLD
jgi:aromatic ring-cleaving dioxygenase